jgi:hypothetical protein
LPNRAEFNFHLTPNLVKFGIVRQTPNIKWPGDAHQDTPLAVRYKEASPENPCSMIVLNYLCWHSL